MKASNAPLALPAPSPNRQIGNPVHVELVSEIAVGDCASQIRGKDIGQAASDEADFLVAVHRKSDAGRRGCDFDGFRVGIVQVKLNAMAELP